MKKAPDLDPKIHAWIKAPSLSSIMAAIAYVGGEARIVGGAVRDALIGQKVEDIDLAVNMPPEAVMKALGEAGIKTVPTGKDHGTVTAIVDHKGYEITSLRFDVETYGRKAKVSFTDDWESDAARRDFTFNALYADAAGKVYDFYNGYEDLISGYVRFIGKAEDRIREDVLRILRFFRFFAWFGKDPPDVEGLKACKELAPLLPNLSVERVWKELGKLLAAPDPSTACALMFKEGVFQYVLPEADGVERLKRLIELEKARNVPPYNLRRLAALLKTGSAAHVAVCLRFSLREQVTIKVLDQLPGQLRGHGDPKSIRRLLYQYDNDKVRDGLLLLAASGVPLDLEASLAIVDEWVPVRFPLQGGDVVSLGIKAGPMVGKILQAVEKWWIEQDFQPSEKQCYAEARRIISEIKKI